MHAALAATVPLKASARFSNPTLSGQILPTGKFSLGLVPSAFVPDRHDYLDSDSRIAMGVALGFDCPQEAIEIEARARAAPLLDNSPYFEETPTRAAKGRKGISPKGRDSVVCGGLILESYYDRSQLSFLTLTVPPLSEGSLESVNTRWGEVCHRFLVALSDKLRPHGLEGKWVYVSEIQEQRWKENGQVYLHLHLVFVNKKRGRKNWILDIPTLRSMWVNALLPLAPDVADCPWVQVKAEQVRKSVRNYLSKYLSKGAAITKEVIDAGQADHLPGHWWGSSHKVKQRVKEHTAPINEALGDLLWELCLHGPGPEIARCHPIIITLANGEERHVGWSGYLSPEFAKDMLSLFADRPPRW